MPHERADTSGVGPLQLIAALATDQGLVDELRVLVEIAVHARRDLWTARTAEDVHRVRRRRRLLEALYATTATATDVGSAEVTAATGSSSSSQSIATASVKEIAQMLSLSPERIRQKLADPADPLTGEQDGPGHPWRIHLATVPTSRQEAA